MVVLIYTVKPKLGVKERELFQELRAEITGKGKRIGKGPELRELCEFNKLKGSQYG